MIKSKTKNPKVLIIPKKHVLIHSLQAKELENQPLMHRKEYTAKTHSQNLQQVSTLKHSASAYTLKP